MKPYRKPTFIAIILVSIFLLIVYFGYKTRPVSTPQLPTIITSFYPIQYFTMQVAGEHFQVINLTSDGIEPHDYEPSTGDIIAMENSKAVIVNGQGFEPWTDQIQSQLVGQGVKFVPLAESIASLETTDEDGHIEIDPHVWLDPILASQQVDKIEGLLTEIDPQNQADYHANSGQLKQRLADLDHSFKSQLSSCQNSSVITSHAAFGYLAKRYGFEQISILGLSPEEDPSPKQIAQITNHAKNSNIKFIFFETLVSSRLADTIAQEVGAKTLVFNPLESLTQQEEEAGEDYFTIQNQNLQNLKIALNCQP